MLGTTPSMRSTNGKMPSKPFNVWRSRLSKNRTKEFFWFLYFLANIRASVRIYSVTAMAAVALAMFQQMNLVLRSCGS